MAIIDVTTKKGGKDDPRHSNDGAILFWLQQSQQGLRQAVLQAFEDQGVDLSTAQWDLLTVLWQRDGISQTALAEASGRDKAGVTRLIDGMAERGLLERRRPPGNRRSYAIHLTDAGRQLHVKLLPITRQVADQALAGIDPQTRGLLNHALKRIQKNLARKPD